ncbi:hypothetical protein KY363_06445 [Candidatus Woesearchaeota archaeon]|nr:hypothetical protein [Candidatus Woesearchaeota archaeon]
MKFIHKRTYLRLKYRASPLKWKMIAGAAFAAILLLAMLTIAELPPPTTVVKQQSSDTYSKWYFTRDECRYIFPEGSCVVDDKYCDKNSYDYQVIDLTPHTKYCHAGTIVYTNTTVTNQQPRIVTGTKSGECEFTVDEGETVRLTPKGYDPDPDVGPAGKLIWTFYNPFDKNGVWRTQKGDAGVHQSKIRLSDGELYDEASFCVEVIQTNRPPVLSGLRDISAKEGDKITLRPTCTDPDGDKVVITISGWMTSDTKTLGYDDAGQHKVTVTCTDTSGEKDTETVTVTVSDANRPPVLSVPSTLTVDEGQTVKITATATDPDGDKVSITYESPFASDGTWKTARGDAGTYNITVTASDGEQSVRKAVRVVVRKVNSAPKITGLQDVTVYEGDTIKLQPRVVDADNDKVTVKYSGWMTSDTKTTGYDDAGKYEVTITATDPSGESAKETVRITVINRNRPPVITALQ